MSLEFTNFEKFINIFSPQRAVTRAAWRNYYRHYDAGSYHRPDSNQRWYSVNDSGQALDTVDRQTVRARARDLERNSDIYNSLLGALDRNLFGNKFRLLPNSGDEVLDEQMYNLFEKWSKKENCDYYTDQSLWALLRMAYKRKKTDGGILIVKRRGGEGLIPFRLMLVEVDCLDRTAAPIYQQNGHRVVDGVELDEHSRTVGYWINQYSLDGIEMPKSKFISKKDCLFFYTKKRPSQMREMCDFSAVLTRIKDVNEFITETSLKQRVLSCLCAIIKRALPTGAALPGRDGITTLSGKDYEQRQMKPLSFMELQPGDDVTVVNPAGQSLDAAQFSKYHHRVISAGSGLSYEAVARDMSESNYSGARQGMIEDDLSYEIEKNEVREVLSDIYEEVIKAAIIAGELPKEAERAIDKEYWIFPEKKWIDPMRETAANVKALQSGQITFAELCAQSGREWKETIDQLVAVQEYAKSKGLDLSKLFDTETPSLAEAIISSKE